MEITVPYEYITVILFSINLAYEKKRLIKYSTLKEIYKSVLEEVLENYHKHDLDNIYFLEDKWEEEPHFKTLPFFVAINNILNKYPHIFEAYNSNALKLKDRVEYEDLINAITEIELHTKGIKRFYDSIHSDNIFSLLDIKTIKNILIKYLNIEHQIERDYLNNDSNLPKYLFIRELFLYDLKSLPEETADAFRYTSLKVKDSVDYEDLPIDYGIWKKCDYYVSPEVDKDGSILFDIVPQLKSLYQYAIFGTDSLVSLKLASLLKWVGIKGVEYNDEDDDFSDIETIELPEADAEDLVSSYDESKNEEENDDEDDEEETVISKRTYSNYLSPTIENIFFTTYLYELNEYLKSNKTENLELTKNRLLYALDDGELNLYQEENIQKEYEEGKMVQVEESDFDFLMIEAIFFCDEVFQSPVDDNTIKKLLFIKTYYTLTKDKELMDIFKKYKDKPEYCFYSTIVFGNTLGNTLKRNLEEN